MADWRLPIAMRTTQGMAVAQAVVDELRRRHIVVPTGAVIERLCAEVSTRAQRQVFKLLTAPLMHEHRAALDQLLEIREDRSTSTLASVGYSSITDAGSTGASGWCASPST